MCDFAPGLCLGFDDVAAFPQVIIMIEIFSRRWDSGSDASFLEQPKGLTRRTLTSPL